MRSRGIIGLNIFEVYKGNVCPKEYLLSDPLTSYIRN